MVPAAAAAMALPAGTEPVKAILRGTGWATSASPSARAPVTTLKSPAGRPVAWNSSASSSVESGVSSEGLVTTGQPAISAAPSLNINSVIG